MDHSLQLSQLTCQAAWNLVGHANSIPGCLGKLKKCCPDLAFAIWRRGPALAFATLYQSSHEGEVDLLLKAIAKFVLAERLHSLPIEATIDKLIKESNTADFFTMSFIQEETLLFVEQVEKYAAGLLAGSSSSTPDQEQAQ
jgi:hypothetical protein